MVYRQRYSTDLDMPTGNTGRRHAYRVEGFKVDARGNSTPVSGLVIGGTEGEVTDLSRRHKVSVERASLLYETDLSRGVVDFTVSD